MGASAVITGSYHGFILSLNLNIPVFVDFDRSINGNRNARLKSVIQFFELQKDCIDKINEDLKFFDIFEEFNEKLTKYRSYSLNFLNRFKD